MDLCKQHQFDDNFACIYCETFFCINCDSNHEEHLIHYLIDMKPYMDSVVEVIKRFSYRAMCIQDKINTKRENLRQKMENGESKIKDSDYEMEKEKIRLLEIELVDAEEDKREVEENYMKSTRLYNLLMTHCSDYMQKTQLTKEYQEEEEE
ncbi:hypothetical protein PPL_04722 [Heterostelium album PN500]|uniref:Uncharacterized protein n=1 Tax=Heterostelium pallidum (strain ATCC 26659 / Pp 5 / PN500) TaxID=670386 RepID=D3B8D0_HETP5|nr:hypothetical protein PPL_04722 [Heterostelium album PN500]EFA82298.1 hypothetical protein PPL_04722 [Heterostelium album PN500]|eukprot:XP_020434415.1 hypothetical protein PPL_04722 [Heterostelium album PN500]